MEEFSRLGVVERLGEEEAPSHLTEERLSALRFVVEVTVVADVAVDHRLTGLRVGKVGGDDAVSVHVEKQL
jgi:hypothetical protein